MLKELAKKYGTDKLEHGYIPYYEKYLPDEPKRLLEFGCYKGASVKMWKEYYPDAKIATFDLFEENPINVDLYFDFDISCYKGDAINISHLEYIEELYDIIIDDASHNSYDQQFTFLYMFVSRLNVEGVYVVEDLHCCNEPFYWNNGIDKFEDTFLYLLQNWTKEKGFPENKLFNGFYKTIIDSLIKDVKLFDNKIAFIFKK